MTRPGRSVRSRTLLAFLLYGAVLLLILSVATAVVMTRTEDDVLERRLRLEVDRLEATLDSGQLGTGPAGAAQVGSSPQGSRQQASQPLGSRRGEDLAARLAVRDPWISVCLDRASQEPAVGRVCDALSASAAVSQLSQGRVIEVHEDRLFPGSPNIFAIEANLAGAPVTVMLDATDLEVQQRWLPRMLGVLGVGTGLAALATLLMSGTLTRYVVAPLMEVRRLLERERGTKLRASLQETRAPEEIAALVATLEQSIGELEEFAERERRFTQHVSHELRNPLMVVRGAAELLELKADGSQKSQVERIRRSTLSMENVIDALLWLARHRNASPEPSRVRVRDLVLRCEEGCKAELGEQMSRVEFIIDVAGTLVVDAPEVVLELVLANLLRNAIEHTPAGSIRVLADEVSVTVEDSGVGIQLPVEELTKIGVTTRRGGTGVGLALLTEICRRLQWSLTIEQREGGGTRAHLRFG